MCLIARVPLFLAAAPQRCDRSGDGRLDHVEIEEFCRELLRRPELDAVFRHYSSNGCVLATAELRDFLGDQGEDASLSHAQSLIHTYELNDWGRSLKTVIKVCKQNLYKPCKCPFSCSLQTDKTVVGPAPVKAFAEANSPADARRDAFYA